MNIKLTSPITYYSNLNAGMIFIKSTLYTILQNK